MDRQYSLTLFRSFANPRTEQRYQMSRQQGYQYFIYSLVFQSLVELFMLFKVNTIRQYVGLTVLIVQIYIHVRIMKGREYRFLLRLLASLFHALNFMPPLSNPNNQIWYLLGSFAYSSCTTPNVIHGIVLFLLETLLFYWQQPQLRLITMGFSCLPTLCLFVILNENRRRAFTMFDFYQKEEKCHHLLQLTIQVPVLVLDINRNVMQSNSAAEQFFQGRLGNLDDALSISQFSWRVDAEIMLDWILRHTPQEANLFRNDKGDQLCNPFIKIRQPIEFFLKEVTIRGIRMFSLTMMNYSPLTQQMKNKQELVHHMIVAAEQLYQQLCLDYQTRNNLRIYQVLREKDLDFIGRCTSDCLILKNQVWCLAQILNDEQLRSTIPLSDFNIKNFIINTFEGFSLRLLEKVNSITVSFEESFPEILFGDKDNFVFIIWAMLWALVGDSTARRYDLGFKGGVHKLNFDKNGYVLQFTLTFKCTNMLAQILQHSIQGTSAFTHINGQPSFQGPIPGQASESQKLQGYMIGKVKHLIKSQGFNIIFDMTETQQLDQSPGMAPTTEESLNRVIQFQYGFGIPKQKGTNAKDLAENVKNIPNVDLTFMRTTKTSPGTVVQWLPKVQVQHAPRNKVDELLKRGSGEPKIKEVVVEEAKSMVTPSLANEDHNNTIEEQDDDHSSEKSSASSFEVSPEHVEFQHRLLRILPNIESFSDEVKLELLVIIEEIIKHAILQTPMQDVDITVSQDDDESEEQVFDFSLRNNDADSQYIPTESSPMRPSQFARMHVEQIESANNSVNGKRANSSALTEGSEHHRYLHHQRLRELQNKLLSPQVMKRFSSQNLKRIIQNRKKSNNILDVFSKNVSEANSARGDSQQSSLKDVFLPVQVVDVRLGTHHREWSYRVSVNRTEVKYNTTILHFMSTPRHASQAEKIRSACNVQLVVVRDLYDVLRCFHRTLQEHRLYYMIVISVDASVRRETIDVVQAIRRIEKTAGVQGTFIAGMADQNQTISVTLQQMLLMILQTPIDSMQIEKMKVRLSSLHQQ